MGSPITFATSSPATPHQSFYRQSDSNNLISPSKQGDAYLRRWLGLPKSLTGTVLYGNMYKLTMPISSPSEEVKVSQMREVPQYKGVQWPKSFPSWHWGKEQEKVEGLGGSGLGRVKAMSQSTGENCGNRLCRIGKHSNNQLQQSKRWGEAGPCPKGGKS